MRIFANISIIKKYNIKYTKHNRNLSVIQDELRAKEAVGDCFSGDCEIFRNRKSEAVEWRKWKMKTSTSFLVSTIFLSFPSYPLLNILG